MKKLIALIIIFVVGFFSTIGIASADVYVRGYYRSNGTYVAPHYRSDPDSSIYNNWSYKGNINPYTGKIGTNTYGLPYKPSVSKPSTRLSTVKLSKREKKVVTCQEAGKTETYCKALYMSKK